MNLGKVLEMAKECKIYLVYGSTGEYSDYSQWNVKSFKDKAQAEQLVEKLNNWCKENGVHLDKMTNRHERWNLKCPYDKYFHCDYTGTIYGLEEVDLV
jgi:hypothetical protein